MGAAGPVCGPELGESKDGTPWFRVGDWRLDGIPYRGSVFMENDLRLKAMDEAGIMVQALSPNPLTYLHWIPSPNATEYCRRHNEGMAEVTRSHPDRFVGFASLPMQDPDAAISELEYAVRELGLLGGYIGTDFGIHLDDERLDPFYETCVKLDTPLFLHPAPSGLDGPLRDERMRRFDLDLVIEFSYEETIATATLLFGGVTTRHPELDVCISHGGGSTAMHLAKLRKLAEVRPSAPEWIREPGAFDKAFQNLWFDCHVTGSMENSFALNQLGIERLVFGTNFGGWDTNGELKSGDLVDTLSSNAAQLLRLDRRASHLLA